MSMLVFDNDGGKPNVVKNVDPSHATQMALEAMKDNASKQ
jgi:hypothetical protein